MAGTQRSNSAKFSEGWVVHLGLSDKHSKQHVGKEIVRGLTHKVIGATRPTICQ